MTARANPVDGAVVRQDGSLRPMKAESDGAPVTREPDSGDVVPIAMTDGRQMSAARR